MWHNNSVKTTDTLINPRTVMMRWIFWYMLVYWPSVNRSRWLDIGQVLFSKMIITRVYKPRRSWVLYKGKKERSQYPAIFTEQDWSLKDVLNKKKKPLFSLLGTVSNLSWAGKIYGLLTKREVNIAQYWPSTCFARSWTETESTSVNEAILTKQT